MKLVKKVSFYFLITRINVRKLRIFRIRYKRFSTHNVNINLRHKIILLPSLHISLYNETGFNNFHCVIWASFYLSLGPHYLCIQVLQHSCQTLKIQSIRLLFHFWKTSRMLHKIWVQFQSSILICFYTPRTDFSFCKRTNRIYEARFYIYYCGNKLFLAKAISTI